MSDNMWENAVKTMRKGILENEGIYNFLMNFEPKDNEKWLVITSAFHLKRALNIGQKVNWNLIPYATDFYLPKNFEWHLSFSFLNNLLMFQNSSHEWIGLISYYFMGRTSKIF